MELKQIDYVVPNRFEYGYGLTPEIVELGKLKRPDVIITVDNGISSVEGVATAKDAGISVVITDHHIAPSALPAAEAILNPNRPSCDFSEQMYCRRRGYFLSNVGFAQSAEVA